MGEKVFRIDGGGDGGGVDVHEDKADREYLAIFRQFETDLRNVTKAVGRNAHEQVAHLLTESILPNMLRFVKASIVHKAVLDEDLIALAEEIEEGGGGDDLRLDEDHLNRLLILLKTVTPMVLAVADAGALPPSEAPKMEHLKKELEYFTNLCDEQFDEDEEGEGDDPN